MVTLQQGVERVSFSHLANTTFEMNRKRELRERMRDEALFPKLMAAKKRDRVTAGKK